MFIACTHLSRRGSSVGTDTPKEKRTPGVRPRVLHGKVVLLACKRLLGFITVK